MDKLLNSFVSNNYEQELKERLIYLKSIVNENNISLNDYFENLQDIEDINLIYFDINKITEEQKNNFIENMKIGHKTKIHIFVNMLECANNVQQIALILASGSNETFKTYIKDLQGNMVIDKVYGRIGHFWSNNKKEILSFLNENNNFQTIKNKLDYYYMFTKSGQASVEGKKRRIEIFLNMINMATEEQLPSLLTNKSDETFKTYKKDENGNFVVDKEYSKIGYFFCDNKDEIYTIIYNSNEYSNLKNKLDYYLVSSKNGQISIEGKKRRIEIFLNMLNIATQEQLSSLLTSKSDETFKTYKKDENGNFVIDKEYGIIGNFWFRHKTEILSIINESDAHKKLREKLKCYYMLNKGGQKSEEGLKIRTEIFLNMLNMANNENEIALLLKQKSTETFKTYKKDENGNFVIDKEYGMIGQFWSDNKDYIDSIINKSERYQQLKTKINDYYILTKEGQNSVEGKKRRIEMFINMLNVIKQQEKISALFNQRNTETFKTYKKDENGNFIIEKEYGNIGNFGYRNLNSTIIPTLFYSKDYSNSKYDIARHNVIDYLNFQRRKKKQIEFNTIEEYIDTLDKTKKETKSLIELRKLLISKKQQLIFENQELTNELNTSVRRAV